ncbi:holin [Actinoplanes sp. NPDC051851]|uniref:holin n=1 Tax=Actinoplanes sp. NPDC051851 TaxID=3154753 RepID=UPI00342C4F93
MFTKKFWLAAAERAVKSGAQALVGLWGLDGFDIVHADLPLAAGVAGGAVVLSVLTSLVSSTVGASDDPSLVTE